MRKVLLTFVLLTAVGLTATSAQDIVDRTKLGQTSMQFLSVSVDARAAAMANAMTAHEGSSKTLFYNPAGLASIDNTADAALGQNQWIGEIEYNYGSLAFRPGAGSYGTVGVSLVSVNYGDISQTIRAGNDQGYEKTGTYSPSAVAAGLGYARQLTNRFSVGGHLKYVRQSLGAAVMSRGDAGMETRKLQKGTAAVDFGVIYRTGFRSLKFAVSTRNFAGELTYAEESFELPLTFRIGSSMDLMDVLPMNSEDHSFLLAVDAMHPRDNVEQVRVGGEYLFMNTIALRAGYAYPVVEQGVNLGIGLQQAFGDLGLGFDYGYSHYGLFDNVHRISLQFSVN